MDATGTVYNFQAERARRTTANSKPDPYADQSIETQTLLEVLLKRTSCERLMFERGNVIAARRQGELARRARAQLVGLGYDQEQITAMLYALVAEADKA